MRYWPTFGQDGWILAILNEQAWSIYYMANKRTLLVGTTIQQFNKGFPERARWAHLAYSSSQSECRVRFILPAWGFSHIINTDIIKVVEHFLVFSIGSQVFQDQVYKTWLAWLIIQHSKLWQILSSMIVFAFRELSAPTSHIKVNCCTKKSKQNKVILK